MLAVADEFELAQSWVIAHITSNFNRINANDIIQDVISDGMNNSRQPSRVDRRSIQSIHNSMQRQFENNTRQSTNFDINSEDRMQESALVTYKNSLRPNNPIVTNQVDGAHR